MKPYNILVISEKNNTLFNHEYSVFKDYNFFHVNLTEDFSTLFEKHEIQVVITNESLYYNYLRKTISSEKYFLLLQNNINQIHIVNNEQNSAISIIKHPYTIYEIKQALDHAIAYSNLVKENAQLSNEVKRLENREFSLLKKEVLNNLSHEIRTPLNAIIGFTNLLEINNDINKKDKEYISIIVESSNRLVNYIENLSEFLRHDKPEENNFTVSIISPFKILQSIIPIFQTITLRKKIVLQLEVIELESQIASIKSNKHKIVSIFSRLISSAAYNANNGYIIIGLTKSHKNSICFTYSEIFNQRKEYNTLLNSLFNCMENKNNTLNNESIEVTLIKRNIKQLSGCFNLEKNGEISKLNIELPLSPGVASKHNKFYLKTT